MAIVTDSIAKYVDIKNSVVLVRKGASLGEMATFILQNKASIVDSDIIIVHVGTNEINRTSVAHYKAGYCNLICLLKREFSHSRIAISAIIPRPVDHDKTGQKIVTINSELSKLCERQHVD